MAIDETNQPDLSQLTVDQLRELGKPLAIAGYCWRREELPDAGFQLAGIIEELVGRGEEAPMDPDTLRSLD